MAMQVDPRLLQQWAQALKGQSAPSEEEMIQDQDPMLVEEPSLEQQSIENQMANNVPDQITQEDLGPEYTAQIPQAPPPQVASPMAQDLRNMSEMEKNDFTFKQYQNARENEIKQLKKYMDLYSQMDQGTDLRPLAAWASGVTGNQQLYQAAQAMAPESSATKMKNIMEQQTALTKLVGDRADLKEQRRATTINNAATDRLYKAWISHPTTKKTEDIHNAYTTIKSSAGDPSAAGDMSLIFSYMKLLDPGSVVREGEFATAQNAAGIQDRIRNVYNKVISGERLTPEQRKDFLRTADRLYSGQIKSQGNVDRQFKLRAEKLGADPESVLMGSFNAPQELSTQDQEALDWANSNPNDPSAAKIKAHLGVK